MLLLILRPLRLCLASSLFLFFICPPPTSTLFPYTTLFRSLATDNNTVGMGDAEPLFRSLATDNNTVGMGDAEPLFRDRKSGSAGMPRPISYAVFCLKKKKKKKKERIKTNIKRSISPQVHMI